ncbi:hypothetical protein [Pseudoxanthomonas sp.]|uniref:hypothetical protein n=1 Tax=Pseudoxanthomonas sp. TaxID=1871049 RepID=UPI003F7E1E34
MNPDRVEGTEARLLAEHAAAVQALGVDATEALQSTLRDLRGLLLIADPQAARRSVGFWGRLIGRDIRLRAEAQALRERGGVLLIRAEGQVARLREHHATLALRAERLNEAMAALRAEMETMARSPSTDGDDERRQRRLAHLTTLHATTTITASQLQLLAAGALAIAERHAQQLPRLALLLSQQRGVRSGSQQGMQLSSARQALDELEACIEDLPSPAMPANQTQENP